MRVFSSCGSDERRDYYSRYWRTISLPACCFNRPLPRVIVVSRVRHGGRRCEEREYRK